MEGIWEGVAGISISLRRSYREWEYRLFQTVGGGLAADQTHHNHAQSEGYTLLTAVCRLQRAVLVESFWMYSLHRLLEFPKSMNCGVNSQSGSAARRSVKDV